MPKRRGPGEGTICKRKDGTFCASLTIGKDALGHQKRIWFYGKSFKEVEEKLTRAKSDRQRGILLDPTRQTVKEYLLRWLEDSVKASCSAKTLETYSGVVRKHILPAIGSLRLAKLAPQHLQRLYREKQDQGLTAMVQTIHKILHRALNQALKWGLVARNVADAVDKPRHKAKEMRAFSQEESGRFLEAAKEDRLFALYLVTVSTGLRMGEALGLKWADLDFAKGTIQIQRSLQWGKEGPYFEEPKTAGSRRTVPLPSIVMAALKTHKAKQAVERLALGAAWEDMDLIFPSEIGTPLNKSNLRNRSYNPILKRAGVPKLRFHDLRHTAASLLGAAGVPIRVISEILGHSSPSITLNIYSHILPGNMEEAAAKMNSILTGANGS